MKFVAGECYLQKKRSIKFAFQCDFKSNVELDYRISLNFEIFCSMSLKG